MLRGGRPPEALAVEGSQATNERMVAHLNIQVQYSIAFSGALSPRDHWHEREGVSSEWCCLQVDFLQQSNQELELKLKDAESANGELRGRVQELSGKNAKICEGARSLPFHL